MVSCMTWFGVTITFGLYKLLANRTGIIPRTPLIRLLQLQSKIIWEVLARWCSAYKFFFSRLRKARFIGGANTTTALALLVGSRVSSENSLHPMIAGTEDHVYFGFIHVHIKNFLNKGKVRENMKTKCNEEEGRCMVHAARRYHD